MRIRPLVVASAIMGAVAAQGAVGQAMLASSVAAACAKCDEDSPTGPHQFAEAGAFFQTTYVHFNAVPGSCASRHIYGCGPEDQEQELLLEAVATGDAVAVAAAISQIPSVTFNRAAASVDATCLETGVLLARLHLAPALAEALAAALEE